MNLHIAIDSGSNYTLSHLKNSNHSIDGINTISYSLIPLSISTDERSFTDDDNLDVTEMVEYLETCKLPSHSACPGIEEWKEAFSNQKYIIALTLTGALSGCYNSCRLAAEEYMEEHPDVKVFAFDTGLIGPCQKLCKEFLVKRFYQLTQKNDAEIRYSDSKIFNILCTELEDYCRNHVNIGFCLQSLTNLANNGRIGKAIAKIIMTLKIFVAGDFHLGQLRPLDKVRGDKKGILAIYNNMMKAGYNGGHVYIDHCFQEGIAEALLTLIRRDWPDAKVEIAPTTGLCSFYAERGGIVIGYER